MSESQSRQEARQAVLLAYAQLQSGRETPQKTVPKIRAILREGGLDASALSLRGNRSAAEIEKDLDAYLEGTKKPVVPSR